MKNLYLILATVLLTACVNASAIQQQKRQEYVKANLKSLDRLTASAILNGEIKNGMTKEQVKASWGEPCGYCYGTTNNSWGDSWEYNSFGTGYYGIGRGKYIYFDNAGRVKGWSG